MLCYLLLVSFPPVVTFQFTETDYRSNEDVLKIYTVVNKNMRIANPVTFQLFPLTVAQAETLGLIANETDPPDTTKLRNVPPDDMPFSPNHARGRSMQCSVLISNCQFNFILSLKILTETSYIH